MFIYEIDVRYGRGNYHFGWFDKNFNLINSRTMLIEHEAVEDYRFYEYRDEVYFVSLAHYKQGIEQGSRCNINSAYIYKITDHENVLVWSDDFDDYGYYSYRLNGDYIDEYIWNDIDEDAFFERRIHIEDLIRLGGY